LRLASYKKKEMKKLKENFLESPPRHPRQLITMIKQISAWTKLFIYSKFKLSTLSFQLGFEEHIPEKQNPEVRPANIQYFKL